MTRGALARAGLIVTRSPSSPRASWAGCGSWCSATSSAQSRRSDSSTPTSPPSVSRTSCSSWWPLAPSHRRSSRSSRGSSPRRARPSLAGRLHRHQPDADGAAHRWQRCWRLRAVIVPLLVPGFRRSQHRADHRADAADAHRPHLPGRWRRRHGHPADAGPLRCRCAGAGRLQRQHHRAAPCCSRRSSASMASRSAWSSARSSILLVQLPALARPLPLLACGRHQRPCRPPDLLADAAACHRHGRQPDHLPGQHGPRDTVAIGAAARWSATPSPSACSRSRSGSSACRWGSCCCRRCRGRWPAGRRARVQRAWSSERMRLLLWVMLFVAAIGMVARDEVVDLLFGWGFDEPRWPRPPRPGRLPAGSPGTLAQRHPRPSLLQRQGHHHAGDGGHHLGRGQRGHLDRHRRDARHPAGWRWASPWVPGSRPTTLTLLLRRRHPASRREPSSAGGLVSLVGATVAALVAAGVLALDLAPEGLPRVAGLLLELALGVGGRSGGLPLVQSGRAPA